MITVGGFNLIVSIATVGKELVLAHQFGTSDAMDAFLVAFLLPSLAINIIAGSFHVAFIPEYIKVREQEGEEDAKQLFSHILSWYLVFLVLLSLLLAAISPFILPIIGSHFDPSKLILSQSLFLLLVPTLLLSGLIKALGSVLNAGERFSLPSISPIVMQIVTIIFLLKMGMVWGIHALAIGMIAGLFFESGILIWGLRSRGYKIMPKWNKLNASTRRIIQQYMPMVIGSLFMGSTAFVDQAMAATIGAGSVSSLSYASKIVLFILGISSIALSTAILPHFSKMVALEDWKNVRHTLVTYVRLILVISIPLTLIIIYFSEPIVRLVFERGAFTKTDTHLVGIVQALYCLQIPFYILGILGVRLLSALIKNQILMIIGGINLLVNIIGNYILMQYWGIAGIGLSTSIVYAISTFLIYITLSRALNVKERSCNV